MKSSRIVRLIILGIIVIGTFFVFYLHINSGSIYPSVHAVCPLGGLENLWALLAGRSNIQKIFSGTMTLFFLTMVYAFFFRRSFCGNICPFGGIFEFIGKLNPKKIKLQNKIDKPLRYLKYIVLIFITISAWVTATLWISPYDPWVALSHIFSFSEAVNEYFIGYIILLVVVVASIFIERFFCKYICPAGALYGIISKISPFKIKRSPCTNCGLCSIKCPMDIDVAKVDSVNSAECIACGNCVSSCPSSKKNLNFTMFKKIVNPLLVVIVTVVVFFGTLLILDKTGFYQVSVPNIKTVTENKDYIKFGDLRGSMTIEDGAKYTGKELNKFYEIMEIPLTVSKGTLLNELSKIVPGYDFHVIKAKNTDK